MKKIDIWKTIAYIYILLPMIIFLVGWTKIYLIGVPVSIAIIFSILKMINVSKKENQRISLSKIDVIKIFIILAIISIWVYWSGVGGFVWQNEDHLWRNEIFEIMVNYKWPAIKGGYTGVRGLSYYIGFWLLPALVGKLVGIEAGYMAQCIWAVIGIALVYQFICRRYKKIVIIPLLIFIFFSGLDIVGQLTYNYHNFVDFSIGTHLENWISGYQYSSISTQLFWVFNQAIYAWLITALLMEEKNNAVVLIMASGVLCATLPMVGLFPIVLIVMYKNVIELKEKSGDRFIKSLLKSTITYENVVGGICAMVVLLLFLGNGAIAYSPEIIVKLAIVIGVIIVFAVASYYLLIIKNKKARIKQILNKAKKNMWLSLMFCTLLFVALGFIINKVSSLGNYKTKDNTVFTYIIFLLLESGMYILLTYKRNRKDKIYIGTICMLMLCPLLTIGSSIDFCMRASIPAIYLMFLFVLDELYCSYKDNKKIKLTVLCICLLLGSITPISEFIRTVDNQNEYIEAGRGKVGSCRIFEAINFSTDVETNIFYKYLSR